MWWEPETNGFFLGECLPGVDPVEGETLRVRRACGHHGDVCWTYDSYYGQGLRFYARTAQSVTGERTNDVVGACLGALDYLSQVLNKGIPNRDIGAIRWSGDRCVRTNALGIVWSGTLLVEEDGLPRGLLLTARVPGEPAEYMWHVEYEYSADFVQGRLPGTIRRLLEIRPGKKQLTDLFRLRSLEVAEGPLEPGMFHYAQIQREIPRLYVYTNNAGYVSEEGGFGSLVPVRYVTAESADRRQPLVRYAVLAAMAAGTVVLWLLLRRERSRAPGE